MQTTPSEPAPGSIIYRISAIAIVIGGVYCGRPFFVPVLLSAMLAFLLAPLVRRLVRWVPEWLAITLGGLVLVLPLGATVVVLATQAQKLVESLPTMITSLEKTLRSLAQGALAKKLHVTPEALLDQISSQAGQGMQFAVVGLQAVLQSLVQSLLIFVVAILMLAYRKHLFDSAERILAKLGVQRGRHLLEQSTSLIESFFVARLIIVVIVGIATTGIFVVFKLPYPLLLGAFVGATTLFPVIGVLAGAGVAMAVGIASLSGTGPILMLLGALIVVHIIESNVLTPKLVGGKLNLNALAAFLAMFFGGLLWGVWGTLLAVPIVAILRIGLSDSPNLHPWGDLLSDQPVSRPRNLLLFHRPR